MKIKPPRLMKGDTLGVIAPAGPVTPSQLRSGLDLLESKGFRVILGRHLYENKGYLAGDDKSRLEDLHAMFRNDEIRALLCARGGYGVLRLLEGIDYDLIRSHPKVLVGYSDVTALLLALHRKTGLVTFHGPMVRGLSRDRGRNLRLLLGRLMSGRQAGMDLSSARVLRAGKAVGNLVGGNLCLLSRLLGTPFMPSLKGAILFLEDRGEAPYRIDRMMTHLRLSGSLNGVQGVLGGEFAGCGDLSLIDEILLDVLPSVDIPVVTGLPLGHGRKNMTLPIGIRAALDTDKSELSFLEPWVY